MKSDDISQLIQKYGPGYVAKNRRSGRVVAHAKKIDTLFKKTMQNKDVIISWVPKPDTKYVFRISLPICTS